MIDHAVNIHICWPLSIQYCHIYVTNIYLYNEENIVTQDVIKVGGIVTVVNKGNNKITELRTILQRESQNS